MSSPVQYTLVLLFVHKLSLVAFDEDTSYLDEAAAPSVPTTIPGAESSAGVPVDEFGLPQIPQAARQ